MKTEMDKVNLEQTTALCREDAGSPTVIGGFTICANGFMGGYRRGQPRQPVCRDEVEIVKKFLSPCRRTRWARALLSPRSCDLKHWIENWAGRYISNGAVIVAALEMGIVCVPYEGSSVALISIHFDDVCARMAERGWYIARDHVTATRINPPEPEPKPDLEFFRKWAAENGIKLGCDLKPDPEPPMPDPEPEPPSIFWEGIAEALGLMEAEEG
jgi:hypothetical protein